MAKNTRTQTCAYKVLEKMGEIEVGAQFGAKRIKDNGLAGQLSSSSPAYVLRRANCVIEVDPIDKELQFVVVSSPNPEGVCVGCHFYKDGSTRCPLPEKYIASSKERA